MIISMKTYFGQDVFLIWNFNSESYTRCKAANFSWANATRQQNAVKATTDKSSIEINKRIKKAVISGSYCIMSTRISGGLKYEGYVFTPGRLGKPLN